MPDRRRCRHGIVWINKRNYTLQEEIGRGASSICYRATRKNKKYVIKEFYPLDIAKRKPDGEVVPIDD